MTFNSVMNVICNIISGLLFLLAVVLLVQNKDKVQMGNLIMIILLGSVAVGVHGLSHAAMDDGFSINLGK